MEHIRAHCTLFGAYTAVVKRATDVSDEGLSVAKYGREKLTNHYMCQVGDAKQKTNRVQNVRLAASVQSSDGVEQGIKSVDLCALSV